MPRRRPNEPVYTLLHAPGDLPPPPAPSDAAALRAQVERSYPHEINERQGEAFEATFSERISLLLGPPGTGKSDVAACVVLGRLEQAYARGERVAVCVGSSTWKAIDNVLEKVADLLDRRREVVGTDPIETTIVRLRSSYGGRPGPRIEGRVEDVERPSRAGTALVAELEGAGLGRCIVVGSTWAQASKRAGADRGQPVGPWFDLLVLDEASQVRVADAAAYFLLLKPDAHVLVAGDPKQLGPVYSYEMGEAAADDRALDSVFSFYQDGHGLTPVALNRTYRGNRGVIAWPRERFYDRDYEAEWPDRSLECRLPNGRPADWETALVWDDEFLRVLDPAHPVVVLTYSGQPFTVANPFEGRIVTALARLYGEGVGAFEEGADVADFWDDRLGIVTPHRAQLAEVRASLVRDARFPNDPVPSVDTVDRFQGGERDAIFATYSVSDKDFVASEAAFILSSRRFNVTLTRARTKFVLIVSDALLQYLPSDAAVAEDASHLQRFVRAHCARVGSFDVPFQGGCVSVRVHLPTA